MKKIIILVFVVSFCVGTSLVPNGIASSVDPRANAYNVVLGERYVESGLVFIVKEMQLGEWVSMDQAQSLSIFSVPVRSNKSSILAIRYDFLNENIRKKVDLHRNFQFTLKDEFGNFYRQFDKPLDYEGVSEFYNKNYPSVYPGERVGQTVFFEAPIESTETLFFSIDARNIGLQTEIVIKLPLKQMVTVDSDFYSRFREAEEKADAQKNQIGPIKIVKPKSGLTVEPGQMVRIEVEIPENSREPDNIFVMIPSYVLKDAELHYQYDVTIPKDQKDSMTVLVIGQWKHGDDEEILSDSIRLKIFDTSAL